MNALEQEIQTPEVMLSPNGKNILNSPIFPQIDQTRKEERGSSSKSDNSKPAMTVATRKKRIHNLNDFGIHLKSTDGELESIKDMLFEGGITLDANAFLDLFNSEDSLPMDNIPLNEGSWSTSNVNNDDQLFNGSELISYNPIDDLNFENLLEENDEEASQLQIN